MNLVATELADGGFSRCSAVPFKKIQRVFQTCFVQTVPGGF
jgi:hypothetical protein